MELSPEQKKVLHSVVTGIREGTQEVKIGGYAGTGKSVLVNYLSKFFPGYAPCAYTGKAANVLRKKGVEAHTIHSSIYKPVYEYNRLVGFEVKGYSELGANGFIIDEASMVPKEIHMDLKSFRIPIIYVGDHGQLEPIGTEFNLMKKPDYTLETIHRNAGDIAKFAELLRNGYRCTKFPESNKVSLKSQRQVATEDYLAVDQVICAYNKTRVAINKEVRSALGYSGDVQIGERIICLKNNRQYGLFNGMQGIVKNVYDDLDGVGRIDFEFNECNYNGIKYDKRFFNVEKPDFDYMERDYPNPFDFAYCITCHKAQGDEFEKVLVVEQKNSNWSHHRWAYTAASRAKESLVWVY